LQELSIDLQVVSAVYAGFVACLRDAAVVPSTSRRETSVVSFRERLALPTRVERASQYNIALTPAAEELLAKGWVDYSAPSVDTTMFVLIDFARKQNFAKCHVSSRKSVMSLLPALCEVDLWHEWVPLLHSAKVLHKFSDFCRLVHLVLKVAIATVDAVVLLTTEDHMSEGRGCIGVYCVSPPPEVLNDRNGVEWMGVKLPPWPTGLLALRMPIAYCRFMLFQESDKSIVKVDFAENHVIDIRPVLWIVKLFYSTMSKRFLRMWEGHAEKASKRLKLRVAEDHSFYGAWDQRIQEQSTVA